MKQPWEEDYSQPQVSGQPWEQEYTPDEAQEPLSWADVGTGIVENFIPSAVQTGKDIYSAVSSPVDTAHAVVMLGAGILQKALPDDVVDFIGRDQASIDLANKVGEFYANRYGGVEEAKRAVATDPVGVLGDLATVLTGAGAAVSAGGKAARVANIASKGQMPKAASIGKQAMTAGEKISKAGAAVEPVSTAAKLAGMGARGAGNVAATVLAGTTGTGFDAVREAYRSGKAGGSAGEAFRGTMRDEISLDEAVSQARAALAKIKADANERYVANSKLYKDDLSELPFDEIYDALNKAERFGVGKSGIVTNQKVIDTLAKIREKVDEFKARGANTAEDLDDLKQAIDDIGQDAFADNRNARAKAAATVVRKGVTDTLGKYAKNWSKTMKDYSEAKQLVNEIENALSIGDKKTLDAATRKLASTMRNNANTNYGKRMEYVSKLGEYGGEDIPALVAGAQFGSTLPQGIARGSGAIPMTTAIDPVSGAAFAGLSAPRVVGEAVHGAGRAAGLLDRIGGGLAADALSNPELMNLFYQAGGVQRQNEEPTMQDLLNMTVKY